MRLFIKATDARPQGAPMGLGGGIPDVRLQPEKGWFANLGPGFGGGVLNGKVTEGFDRGWGFAGAAPGDVSGDRRREVELVGAARGNEEWESNRGDQTHE